MTDFQTSENAWKSFEQSGRISDYLKYNEYKQDTLSKVGIGTNANKDTRDNFKAAEYR